MSGFFPEDQHDYSPEPERKRQQESQRITAELEYYNANRKRDSVAETAKNIPSSKKADKLIINDVIERLISEG